MLQTRKLSEVLLMYGKMKLILLVVQTPTGKEQNEIMREIYDRELEKKEKKRMRWKSIEREL